MNIDISSEKKKSIENIAIYITINGLPLFSLPYKKDDDSHILISSFLHTIDILAKETRNNIGRSADFYGFDLINNIAVEVLEISNQDVRFDNKIRLFLQTPYGKTPVNRSSIAVLFGATRAIIPKINSKEINAIYKKDTNEFFIKKLNEMGYTAERIMSELQKLTVSQAPSSNYIPISLFSIEKKKDGESGFNLVEIGNYNSGKYKKNPIKNDEGELNFDSGLIIGLADALRSYKIASQIQTESIILRFRDYSIGFYYKKDGLPVMSVFIAGSGNFEDIKKYHNDLRNLDLEISK